MDSRESLHHSSAIPQEKEDAVTESECLAKMIPPGQIRQSKPYRGGVIQVWATRACDKACYNCTQASQLGGRPEFITLSNFTTAVKSLVGYFGVVGLFGGNPAIHPGFGLLCQVLRNHIPWSQLGI